VIVQIVNINRIGFVVAPRERQSPIFIDPYRVAPFVLAFEAVEMPSGHVHAFGTCRRIERAELPSDLFDMTTIKTTRIALPPEPFESFAAETADHVGFACPDTM